MVSRAQADEREKKRIVNQIKQNMDSQHKTNNQNSNGNQNMNQNQNGGSNDDHTSVIRYVDHSNKEGRKYRSRSLNRKLFDRFRKIMTSRIFVAPIPFFQRKISLLMNLNHF